MIKGNFVDVMNNCDQIQAAITLKYFSYLFIYVAYRDDTFDEVNDKLTPL